MNKSIYRITINNWEKYNGSLKRGHKQILLSTGFLSNAKIRALTPVTRLLYLSCLLVAGESTQSQIEVSHESLVFHSGVKSGSLQSQLDQLQSFQLVTYEKIDSLYNRIEKKRIEKKRIEDVASVETAATKALTITENKKIKKDASALNKQIWESYKDAYLKRYGVDPIRNVKVNTQISQLGERVGTLAIQLVQFYLTHNDHFFLKNTHSIGYCLANAETLCTQFKRGACLTSNNVKEFIQAQNMRDINDAIESGTI